MVLGGSDLLFYMWIFSLFFPTPFVEETVLFPCQILEPVLKVIWLHKRGFTSGLSLFFHWSICLSGQKDNFAFLWLSNMFEIRLCEVSICSFFQVDFGYSASLEISCKYQLFFFYFWEKIPRDFDRDCIESVDH